MFDDLFNIDNIIVLNFQDVDSARKSCKLNGTEIDSHVIRVDIAGKGKLDKDEGKGPEHDQSKAVFLGNVKFNEQEDNIRKHFEKCGHIIDVRIVRDTTTGMGKGFGYVNFDTSDAVEKVSYSHSIILHGKCSDYTF